MSSNLAKALSRIEKLRLAVDGERQRCLALVTAYRKSVESKFSKIRFPTSEQTKVVKRIVDALLDIEQHIRHPVPQAEPSQVLPGDFSIEEMERAAAIIEEQERNPFDG